MHKLPLNDSGLYVEFATKEELMLIAATSLIWPAIAIL